jgi:hypothetical protein
MKKKPITGLLVAGLGLLAHLTTAQTVSPDSTRRAPDSTLTDQRPVPVPLLDTTGLAGNPNYIKPQLRPSPVALASYKDESTYLKIVYGQPMKKGRVIFGGLEKFGKVWRTGANEATELTFTRDVKLGGKVVKAGTYALFSIPNPDRWTIILNGDLGQWGAYSYKPERDVLRFEAAPEKNAQVYEALTFKFEETDSGADLLLFWDDVKVPIPIGFSR